MYLTKLQQFYDLSTFPTLLAETASPSARILISAIILLALIALVIWVAVVLRKWFYQQDNQTHGGFLLSDLRRMHKQGHLTDQELEAAKKLIIKHNQLNESNNNNAAGSNNDNDNHSLNSDTNSDEDVNDMET